MPRPMVRFLVALAVLGATACSAGNAQLENDVRDLNTKVQSIENRVRRIEGLVSKVGKGMKGKAAKGKAAKGKAKSPLPDLPTDDGGGEVPPG